MVRREFQTVPVKKPKFIVFLYWTCIEWNHVLNRNVAFSICGGMKIGWNRSLVWRWKRLSTFPCQMIRFRDLWFTASGQPTRAGTTLTGCRSISRYPRLSTVLEEGSNLTKLDVLHRKALSSIAHIVYVKLKQVEYTVAKFFHSNVIRVFQCCDPCHEMSDQKLWNNERYTEC